MKKNCNCKKDFVVGLIVGTVMALILSSFFSCSKPSDTQVEPAVKSNSDSLIPPPPNDSTAKPIGG